MNISIISNDSTYVYNLRNEAIFALIENNCNVSIICQAAQHIEELNDMGCSISDVTVKRHGKNPFQDIVLLYRYYKYLKDIKPDVVLSYNIKPNIYGGIACSLLKIPFLPNICGLGTALEYPGILQKITALLYKVGIKKASCVFFQNTENQNFFKSKNLISSKAHLLPGSGVNTKKYTLLDYPISDKMEFLFISRVMKDKGADQYLQAAQIVKKSHPEAIFHVIGGCDDNSYLQKLESLQNEGVIIYHGQQKDILSFQKISCCTIHPTYYPEGMSNVLLESAACGRPIITTDRSGCREIVEDGINGFVCKQKDTEDLVKQIEKFLALSWDERKKMGLAGRAKVVKEFDRQIVVNAYLDEIAIAAKI